MWGYGERRLLGRPAWPEAAPGSGVPPFRRVGSGESQDFSSLDRADLACPSSPSRRAKSAIFSAHPARASRS